MRVCSRTSTLASQPEGKPFRSQARVASLALCARLLTLQLIKEFAELLRYRLGDDLIEDTPELSADVFVDGEVAAGGRFIGSRRLFLLPVGLSFGHGHLHRARTSYILPNGTQRSRTLLKTFGQRAIVLLAAPNL